MGRKYIPELDPNNRRTKGYLLTGLLEREANPFPQKKKEKKIRVMREDSIPRTA